MVTLDEAGRNREHASVRPAVGPRRALVEHDFVLDFRGTTRRRWKVLPDLAPHIIVHLPASGAPPTLRLVGARRHAIEVDVSGRAWTVGVRLAPGALPALTGLPASDFTDRSVEAASLPGWSDAVDRFHERAAAATEAGDPEDVRHALTSLVAHRVKAAGEVSWVARGLGRVARAPGRTKVSEVAARLGLASRTLRLRAAAEMGLGPKQILRVGRLFRSLAVADARGYTGWAAVASCTGYADQAHLVRDFGRLLGESPTSWALRRADADSSKPASAPGRTFPDSGARPDAQSREEGT